MSDHRFSRPRLQPCRSPLRWGRRRATVSAAAIVAGAGMMVWVPGVAGSAGGATPSSPVGPISREAGALQGTLITATAPQAVMVPPAVAVGSGPVGLAFDSATHTLYSSDQNTNTVSVINTAKCNAHDSRGCRQRVHSIRLPKGANPQGIELDPATGTAYVADIGTNTISVIDTRICNSADLRGCGRTAASIRVPGGPLNLAVDEATDTVYAADFGTNFSGTTDTVSVINGATCNGERHSGCDQTPATVKVGRGPDAVAVDPATHTGYVTDNGATSEGDTVSVFNTATCDGTHHAGYRQAAETIGIGHGANWIAIDPGTHTAYTANNTDSTVSVINTAICNASRHSGCGQKTPTVTVGPGAYAVTVDQALHTVYVANFGDDTLSAINESTCDAAHRSGCGHVPPTSQVGDGPDFLVTAPATGTVYSANSVDNTVSVINAAACDATNTVGCRHPAPTATVGAYPFGIAVDQAHHSIYVANEGDNTVSVINAATCNAARRTRCRPAATIHVGSYPAGIAVDQATGTVYVVDSGDKTVSVINTAACNATHPAGCKPTPPVVHVGTGPAGVAINSRTDTVYVTDSGSTGDSTVSVINGATCNATHRAGCSQTPPSVTVGFGATELAVNDATDTVYVANFVNNQTDTAGDTVSVINGTTCNGRNHTGCAQTPATVTVGSYPYGIAIDQATNTIYVANNANAGEPGTLSAIKGATCDAANTTGCHLTPPILSGIGRAPGQMAYDPSTHTIYTANVNDATVSVVDVARRRPQAQPPRVAVGITPIAIAIDPGNHTIYVANLDPVGTVSILSETPVRTSPANQAEFHVSHRGNNVASRGEGSRPGAQGSLVATRPRRQSAMWHTGT
jgi:YVTN family beta-propeller protein